MKTAISIPDDIFAEADAAARRVGVSRSEFYVTALRSYLKSFRDDWITERLDAVYDGSEKANTLVERAARSTLRNPEWDD